MAEPTNITGNVAAGTSGIDLDHVVVGGVLNADGHMDVGTDPQNPTTISLQAVPVVLRTKKDVSVNKVGPSASLTRNPDGDISAQGGVVFQHGQPQDAEAPQNALAYYSIDLSVSSSHPAKGSWTTPGFRLAGEYRPKLPAESPVEGSLSISGYIDSVYGDRKIEIGGGGGHSFAYKLLNDYFLEGRFSYERLSDSAFDQSQTAWTGSTAFEEGIYLAWGWHPGAVVTGAPCLRFGIDFFQTHDVSFSPATSAEFHGSTGGHSQTENSEREKYKHLILQFNTRPEWFSGWIAGVDFWANPANFKEEKGLALTIRHRPQSDE